jgi:hypothetical protein
VAASREKPTGLTLVLMGGGVFPILVFYALAQSKPEWGMITYDADIISCRITDERVVRDGR